MPYRSTRFEAPRRAAEPGIVGEMVQQFADRYAFLRELVQNGIDAGATGIDVRIGRDAQGAVRTTVEDDGCGMARADIEGPLLTLFSSSKEKDGSKIGKYGIGFVSVFAIEPMLVEVITRRRQDPHGWLVRLHGDHTWELEVHASTRPGTAVTLVGGAEELSSHVAEATIALRRWCRHARVPIRIAMGDAGDGAPRVLVINEPLAVNGLVTIEEERNGERIVLGAGPTAAGFYNHGLTLFESGEPEEGTEGISFKVDSPHLAHTLSRDNVRRDGELARVLDRVRALARGPLWKALDGAITAAAEEGAAGAARHLDLVDAALAPAFTRTSRAEALVVPLVHPIAGRRSMPLRSLGESPIVFADSTSPLTQALANAGRPVVLGRGLAARLRRLHPHLEVVEAGDAFSHAEALADPSDVDTALEQRVAILLNRVKKSVQCAKLASFSGRRADVPFRVVPKTVLAALTSDRSADPRAWGPKATVFLNIDDAAIRLARRRARSDVDTAAHLLVRALLVVDGPLEARAVDRLLEAASD